MLLTELFIAIPDRKLSVYNKTDTLNGFSWKCRAIPTILIYFDQINKRFPYYKLFDYGMIKENIERFVKVAPDQAEKKQF